MAVEGKLVVPHRERAVEVEFRTTLASGGPVDASWGLSFFAAAALCSADEASAPCRAGVSPPGDFGGLVDGELALVGDAGLLTIAFTDIVKRALGISLWYMGGTQAVCSVRMVGWSTCAESCRAHSPTLCVCVCVFLWLWLRVRVMCAQAAPERGRQHRRANPAELDAAGHGALGARRVWPKLPHSVRVRGALLLGRSVSVPGAESGRDHGARAL